MFHRYPFVFLAVSSFCIPTTAAAPPNRGDWVETNPEFTFSSPTTMLRQLEAAHVNADVVSAMEVITRRDFVPPEYARCAYSNVALPLDASGKASISHPVVIAFMLDALGVQRGDHIFELGTGSGYQTALLARLAGQEGKVVSAEIDRDLAKKAASRLRRLGFGKERVAVTHLDGSQVPETAWGRFDRVICAAAVPMETVERVLPLLKEGGRLVAPVLGKNHEQSYSRWRRTHGAYNQEPVEQLQRRRANFVHQRPLLPGRRR